MFTSPQLFLQKMRKYLRYFQTLCIFADKILFNLKSIHSKPRFMGNQMFHTDICGELMADISTSPDAQPFKYGGKVLAAKRKIGNRSARRRALARVDSSFGLDLYDFHARQRSGFKTGQPSLRIQALRTLGRWFCYGCFR